MVTEAVREEQKLTRFSLSKGNDDVSQVSRMCYVFQIMARDEQLMILSVM